MITLFIDPQNQDLVLDEQGNFVVISGPEEKKQSLRMLLKTHLGEFFLDTSHGTDYSDILGSRPGDEDIVKGAIREALAQEPRISEIRKIEVEFEF